MFSSIAVILRRNSRQGFVSGMLTLPAFKADIRGKMVLLALFCAVLPCVLISALAVKSSRDALERGVRVELFTLVNEQMSRLTSLIERAKTDLGTWSTLYTMQ